MGDPGGSGKLRGEHRDRLRAFPVFLTIQIQFLMLFPRGNLETIK